MIGPEAMRALLLKNEGSWDTPEIVTAIEAFFVTLRDAGCFPDDANAITYDDGNSLFFTGEALLHTTGSWLVERHRGQHARLARSASCPSRRSKAARAASGSPASARPGSSPRAAQHPDEAAAFIDYLFSPGRPSTSGSETIAFFVPVEFDMTNIEVDPLNTSILDMLADRGRRGRAVRLQRRRARPA